MRGVQRLALSYLGALIIAGYGYMVGEHHWWPHDLIREISDFVKGDPEEVNTSVMEKLKNDLGVHPHRKLIKYNPLKEKPDRAYRAVELPKKKTRRQDPVVYINSEARPALRFIYGSFDHEDGINGAILLSETGERLWEWVITEDGLPWRLIANEERKFPHGVIVGKDGSLIVAYDNGNSLQKFDRCSQRVWAEKAKVDHSLELNDKGEIWAVMGPNSLGLYSPKDGKLIKRINMNRIMTANPQIDPLGIRQTDYSKRSRWYVKGGSYWHPNDADPLPKAYADAFPQFAPGDLLVSLRSINLIFVVSPDDLKIKWWRSGGWRRQHDPDWQANGKITLYNNNMHRDSSNLIEIDPKTYEQRVIFDGKKEGFYTWMRGKHELLDKGHIALSSPQQGRVFEIDSEGEVVFEFVNRYDDTNSMLVSELVTLPLDYFDSSTFKPCRSKP